MIKGKIKKIIFQNDSNGYTVALFRLRDTDEEQMRAFLNKTITITGIFTDLKLEINIIMNGSYQNNEKYGKQYIVENYEIEKPTTEAAIIEFLASSFVDSCGLKTAQKIVAKYKEKSLDIIKEDYNHLLVIEGMTFSKAKKIYDSLINYDKTSDMIVKLQNLGFTIDECNKIYNKFKNNIDGILKEDFYDLKEIIEFNRLDSIYLNNYEDDLIRKKACILKTMEIISDNDGDVYYYNEDILEKLAKNFNIYIDTDTYLEYIDLLEEEKKIVKLGKRIYLKKYYDAEENVADTLKKIESFPLKKYNDLEEKLENLEKKLGFSYNEEQKKAIISALNNNVSIISGGPGTGKTTIIKAIVSLYISENKLNNMQVLEQIALLAPTGRASKKMASSTELPASTIHRYLKWYKEKDDFYYNELNKTKHRLIIVDEVSMIDINLFNALLKGISSNVKLILVGDIFQLPSVSAGLVLNDLINCDCFNYVPLNIIYRQSNNSYIPYLAREIKNVDLSEDFLNKKDDYSFFNVSNSNIKAMIEKIINISREQNIDERKMQILAPMYKGENGIDNLNVLLQNIYNPKSSKKVEINYGDAIFREGDKVLQLVNDIERNVFNGDIGYIKSIGKKIIIDFENNVVEYEKKDLFQIKHAYAITIHKSQGSEFEHVIMPISKSYFKMLYNKLIYTGVSRAKKSLTIVGDPQAFIMAVKNNYSNERKTSLKEKIIDIYKKV
ncbi:MAG: ATP-dependent RecD-like DNA helicase [Firmicutes bacterium]|nr:ATP-dependent RecD-like DNA helicase [Bacillota bacterium]